MELLSKCMRSRMTLGFVVFVSCLASCGVVWAAPANEAQAEEKAALVHQWQRYFQSLRSLEYEYKSVIDQHPIPNTRGNVQKFKVKVAGSRFRVESDLGAAGNDVTSRITAYDDKLYQQLTITQDGGALLNLYSRPLDLYPYGSMPPALSSFSFAFRDGDPWTIEFLQTATPWRRVEQNIEKIESGTHAGINGRFVTIKGQNKLQSYRVFIDDKSNFPLHFQFTKQIAIRGKMVTQVSEIEVEKSLTWQGPSMQYLFPLKDHAKAVREGKVFVSGYNEVTSPVKINQGRLSNSIFTIPRSQATSIYDRDLADRIHPDDKAEVN